MKPGLFGITHSNRDFTQANAWGKNQFNSSFPAGLTNFMCHKKLENKYICLDKDLEVKHQKISTEQLYGIKPTSDDLFFAFESQYTPYQQFVIGSLPRVDLVTQSRANGQVLRPIEIKLTTLPDHSTHLLSDENHACELVARPDTIVYLACSIVVHFKDRHKELAHLIGEKFDEIKDWSDGNRVWSHITDMIVAIDKVILAIMDKQEPILLQPIWKTNGKSPQLANNCLDVFVWSNFAFARLFMDAARKELEVRNKITRQIRTVIWLFKMLYDFAQQGRINHRETIDDLSYNTKNDKAFAIHGNTTHKYMACAELTNPRVTKKEIKQIILGGGQHLLSPERRFDAIIFNSPELFV